MENFMFYDLACGWITVRTAHEDGSFTIEVYTGGKRISYTVYHDCVCIVADPETGEPLTAYINVKGRKSAYVFDNERNVHKLKIRIPA